MQGDERERSHEDLWKSQEDAEMQIKIDELCARAHGHERNNARMAWAVTGFAPLLAWACIYSLQRFHNPWLIAAFCYFIWISVKNGTGRKAKAEPCVDFLRRLYEGRRRWALEMRWAVLLCVPAILACMQGGGPLLRAKSLGITSPWLLQLLAGPAVLVVMAVLLAAVWLLMTQERRRLDREIQRLGRE